MPKISRINVDDNTNTIYTQKGPVNKDSIEAIRYFFSDTIKEGNFTGVSINLTNTNTNSRSINVTGGMSQEDIAKVQKRVCTVIDENYSSIIINLEVDMTGDVNIDISF